MKYHPKLFRDCLVVFDRILQTTLSKATRIDGASSTRPIDRGSIYDHAPVISIIQDIRGRVARIHTIIQQPIQALRPSTIDASEIKVLLQKSSGIP